MKQLREIVLTIEIEQEDTNLFAAYCKELGTTSCGTTLEEATTNIKDAVLLHLDELELMGVKEQRLREGGAKVRTRRVANKAPTAPAVELLKAASAMRVPVLA